MALSDERLRELRRLIEPGLSKGAVVKLRDVADVLAALTELLDARREIERLREERDHWKNEVGHSNDLLMAETRRWRERAENAETAARSLVSENERLHSEIEFFGDLMDADAGELL